MAVIKVKFFNERLDRYVLADLGGDTHTLMYLIKTQWKKSATRE